MAKLEGKTSIHLRQTSVNYEKINYNVIIARYNSEFITIDILNIKERNKDQNRQAAS